FMSALMFIGASPSSAGGGIRTTTFALVLIFMITYARGGKRLKLFNRQIYDKDLMKAVTIMILATFFIFFAVFLLRGKRLKLFNRQIYDKDLMKAVTIMILATFFIFFAVFLLSLVEPFSLTAILFEVTSAFGTVGLSLGITEDLTTFSKVVL